MSKTSRLEFSFVVPLFNEQGNVVELCRRLTAVGKKLHKSYEIIIVDDGSTDTTPLKLRTVRKKDTHVKIIALSRNFGQQAAATAGLDHSRGKYIVLMDGDLQDEPEFIPTMFKKLIQGYDVVYAQHPKRQDTIFKRLLIKLFYKLLDKLSSYKLPLDAGMFCLMTRRVVDTLGLMSERNRYISGLRAWVGFAQIGIDYEKKARFAGKPPQTLRKLVRLALDALFSFSYIPLKLATLMGLVVMVGAMAGIVDVFVEKYFTHTAVIGWSGPMLSILITGGVQLFILGIVGEYLARIYDEVKRRPYYIIAEKLGL